MTEPGPCGHERKERGEERGRETLEKSERGRERERDDAHCNKVRKWWMKPKRKKMVREKGGHD